MKLRNQFLENVQSITRRMSVGVAMGATLMGGAFYAVSNGIQQENKAHRELTFSEIEKTTLNLQREGKPVPPLTRYYSVTSDYAMKVFEASNNGYRWNSTDHTHDFAYELEKTIEPTLRVHAQLPEYAQELPGDAQASLKSIDKQVKAELDLPAVINEFANTWKDHHHDVTHPETHRSCDSKGNCTSTTVEVYDYTIHTYNYDKAHGEAAARLLTAFIQNHPEINVDEKLIRVTSTEADNESAIHHSFHKFKDRYPTVFDYIEAANIWLTGSNLIFFTPSMLGSHAQMKQLTPQWNAAKESSHNHRYITYSRTDAGPREFQIAQAALEQNRNLSEALHKITDGMQFTMGAAPQMNDLAKQCVNAALHYKPGDANKLCNETLKLAEDIYAKNFEGGVDVHPYKWGWVVFWTVLGLAIGGGMGAGVETYLDEREYKGTGLSMRFSKPRF